MQDSSENRTQETDPASRTSSTVRVSTPYCPNYSMMKRGEISTVDNSNGNGNGNSNSSSNSSNSNRRGGSSTGKINRDIYHRERRLAYWLERLRDQSIPEEDREDILRFVRHQQEEQKSALRIIRCITALLTIRGIVGKRFRECTRDDIRRFIEYMDEKGYSISTQYTFKEILKYFFKVVYGNNQYYPDAVAWIRNRVSKDKAREKESLSYNDFLTEEEVVRLIDASSTLQRKAFIAVGYETGARPEELLNIRIRDILFDSKGARIILRGKTGERVTRVIAYAALLREWLSIHPFRNDPDSYLWLSEATNHRYRPIGLRSAEKAFAETMKRAGIRKSTRLYILRHSRATHLANKLTEAQLCAYFGWSLGTKVVQRYIHLAGVNTDNVLLELAGIQIDRSSESILRVKYCKRCREQLSPNHDYCIRCGYSESDAADPELKERIDRLEAVLSELLNRLSSSNSSSNSNSSNSSNSNGSNSSGNNSRLNNKNGSRRIM